MTESLWRRAIGGAEQQECSSYTSALRSAARDATDDEAIRLRTLADVTSMALPLGAGIAPLKPFYTGPNGRTAIPEDLSEAELDDLADVLQEEGDAELGARLSDVLWTRRRAPEHARRAVDDYLASASRLETSGAAWRARVERAMAFALIIKDRERVALVVHYLKSKVDDPSPSYLTRSTMELLLKHTDETPGKWALHAERHAAAAAAQGNILLEREFHECAAAWHRRNGDADAARRSRQAEAETYVAEAERSSEADSALLMKVHFYQQAIEAFRRVGNCRERVDDLHRIVLALQERVAATAERFEGPNIDVNDMVRGIVARFTGCTFPEALLRLAIMVKLPSYSQLRSQAEEFAMEYPLAHLMGRQRVNEKGHVIVKTPGGDLQRSDRNEATLLTSTFEQLERARGVYVVGMIDPARRKIWADHSVSEHDFYPLVVNNPLVPPGRETLLARGLYAGLTGDFLQAAHILVPQVEHMVRFLLGRRGVITTSLDSDGVQEENSFNTLLEKPELTDVLGADLVFDMKSLLVDKRGANLRNLVAHGLMSHDEFFTAPVAYVWWLALKLCFLPVLQEV